MPVDVRGYSERGLVWTLFSEIAHRVDAAELIVQLLSIGAGKRPVGAEIPTTATILIEQSFSDFGDADVVVLLDFEARKQCVFIEAKVCCGNPSWRVRGEYSKLTKRKIRFSNLFCQLFAKQRLVETLRAGNVPHDGVVFLEGFSKRRIGANQVVLRAVNSLRPYVGDASFVALVPNADGFAETIAEFATFARTSHDGWHAIGWGGVEEFCRAHQLPHTLAAFEYNRGQIY